METPNTNRQALVARCYSEMSGNILNYISQRVNDRDDAEDLAQETFVRLLTCDTQLLLAGLRSFVFTVARNLVMDYLRKKYCRAEVHEMMMKEPEEFQLAPDEHYICNELKSHECRAVDSLPPQRRTIYNMSRFMEHSTAEIAQSLNLSPRTVECHLRLGRQDVRSYMRTLIS